MAQKNGQKKIKLQREVSMIILIIKFLKGGEIKLHIRTYVACSKTKQTRKTRTPAKKHGIAEREDRL